MTDGSLKYNFAGIEGLVGDINGVTARLTQVQHDLETRIAALAATWEGDNQAAYADVQRKWNANHNDLLATLNTISRAVSNGGNAMMGTEGNLQRGWLGGV